MRVLFHLIILECAEQLAVPVTMIGKLSVKHGVFTTKWKEANIVPVFKMDSRKLPENYRAVSLLPMFGKILERAEYEALFQRLRPVLSDKQHGLLPRRSCDTNLACLLASAWQSTYCPRQSSRCDLYGFYRVISECKTQTAPTQT